jgi:hypothetical protein
MINGLDCSGYRWKKQTFGRMPLRCFATKTVLKSSLLPFPMPPDSSRNIGITIDRASLCFLFVDDVVSFAMLRASCAEYAST